MAGKNIKGITIQIGGETTELQKALKQPEQDIKRIGDELKEVDKALRFKPDSLELLTQKSAVLGNEIAAVSEKLKILKDNQEDIKQRAASGDIGEEQYRAFNREISATRDQLNGLKEELKDNGHSISEFSNKIGSSTKNAEAFKRAVDEHQKAVEKAKDSAEELGKSVSSLGDDFKKAQTAALSFSDAVKATAIGTTLSSGVKKLASSLWDFAAAGAESARNFEVNEQKLELILKNTVNATDEYIQSVKDLIEEEERLGVVSKAAQTAAAQELATYVTKQGTLEKLIPVLNNMIAQQDGVNASQEAAVAVATQLGKALDGQVGSLQRWGYRFEEAEQAVLKTGSELRKADVIINSVTESVGGLSYGLRETTEEGRLFGQTLDLQSVQEKFGKSVSTIKTNILVDLLPALTEGIDVINEGIVKNASTFEKLGKILAAVINTLANLLAIVLSIPAPVLAVVAGLLLAAKAFSSAQTGIAAFSKVVGAASSPVNSFIIKILALVAALSVLLFLILAIKDGTDQASKAIENAANSAGKLADKNVNSAKGGYARGTRSASAGLHWVGEEGPELVNFRGGEQVYTAAQSARMAASGANSPAADRPTNYTYIDNSTVEVRNIQDINETVRWRKSMTRHARLNAARA